MNIKRVVVGPLQTNCYVLVKDNKAILIDPGDNQELIEENLKGLDLQGILVTHSHFDHVGSLEYFLEKYHVKYNEKIDGFNYQVIKTPGHSKDSLTFYFQEDNIMFTGDFIFKGTIGRMDLPSGSEEDMQKSLEKISRYVDKIAIYPGHGEKTILGEEKKMFKYYF